MGLPPIDRGNDIGGPTVVGYLCYLPPEHVHTIHYYQANYGPVSGGSEMPGDEGVEAVVGAGVT